MQTHVEATQSESASPPSPVVRLGCGDWCIATVVALVALGLYARTLAPGLLRADVAEFHTLAVTLGYAHPTGYPVYLLLGKLATMFPVGDIPYRVNLLSAVMGALAAGGICLLGKLLTGRRWVPVAGAIALAVSPTFWSQAIIAEVYTAGLVCMVGILLAVERWRQTAGVGWLTAAACLGGISLGVHATVALMAPAALLVVLLTRTRWKANWTAAVVGALVGLLLLLAAYGLIDRADSRTSYFRTVIEPSRSLWNLEPEDLDGFFDRVTLSLNPPQYRGLLFSKPPEVTLDKAKWYAWNLTAEFPPLWLAAALVGVVWLGRRNGKMTLLLVLTYATHLGYDLFYDMGGIHVLYLATYVPVALFGSAGLACAVEGCAALAARHGKRRRPDALFDRWWAAVGLCVVAWPLWSADAWNVEGRRLANLPPDEQDAPVGVEYSATFHREVGQLIDELEPDAVVFTGWCFLYPYYYVAHVEKGRTDLEFCQDYPQAYHFELADSALEYVKQVAPHRPVYFTHVVGKVAEAFEMTPVRRGRETLYRVGRPIPR